MIKLLRVYGKPFIPLFLLVVCLLFIRAFSELALPQYMSNIVDNGIARRGIDHPIPGMMGDELFNVIASGLPDFYADLFYELSWRSGDIWLIDTDAIASAYDMQDQITRLMALTRFEGDPILLTDRMADQIARGIVAEEYASLGIDMDARQMSYIINTGGMMLLITFISISAAIGTGFISSRIATGISRRLRVDIFNKVTSFTNTEYNNFSTATLITRSTNDVNQVQNLLAMGIRMIIFSPIMAVGGVIMVVGTDGGMAWVIALSIGLIIGFVGLFYAIAAPRFRIIQKLVDKVNLVTRESLTGIMVIRAFGTQKHEEDRFDGVNTSLFGNQLFLARAGAFQMPVITAIMNFTTILIVWLSAASVQAGNLQVGHMMAFIQYAMFIIMSFLMLSWVFMMMPRASVAASRIMEVLNTSLLVRDPQSPSPIPNATERAEVEFKNVSFKYAGASDYALSDISFVAKTGEVTAFVGSTGSGKTALVNLIPRFYDTSDGEVLINGMNVRSCAQKELRALIGYVPQKAVLFSGTIADNIKYADASMDDAAMHRAAQIAQAADFINEKPEGYNDEITQGGTNVSGGQRQRLAIARAIAKDPKIYIFDDSFSALDFKTDAKLRAALADHTKTATTLIVAQRLSTIKNADQIIVLDEGKIVGIGKHRDLLVSCEVYRQIASSQLSDKELEQDLAKDSEKGASL